MPEVYLLSDNRINFETGQVTVDKLSIVPRLSIELKMTRLAQPGHQYTIGISSLTGDVNIVSNEGIKYVGHVQTVPYFSMSPNSPMNIICTLDFDHYVLNQIEKLRVNKDVVFQINIDFVYEIPQPTLNKGHQRVSLQMKIPKSDWVENILPELKFRENFLLEIPRLPDENSETLRTHIDSAFKQYSMGNYDKVLTDCRKVLEELKNITLLNKFGVDGEIDFKNILASKEIADIIDVIYRKLLGFTAPGSHTGRSINKEDADFALISTYAFSNLILRKITGL
jgi:hypothetical protein